MKNAMKKKTTEEQKREWFTAVRNNDIETVKKMLKEGFDVKTVDENGWTALHSSCSWEYLGIAELLIENGADINAKDNEDRTPLLDACYCDSIDVAKFLIENKADVNTENNEYLRTPLHWTCYWGKINIAKILIDNGADITVKDDDGYTPLDRLEINKPKQYEELMEWLAEHHPEKALERIASENIQSKSVGL